MSGYNSKEQQEQVHDPLFSLGPLPIHPFGFFVALGILVGYVVAVRQVDKAGLPLKMLPGLLISVVLGGFLASRLGFLLLHPGAVAGGLQGAFSLWQGGFSLVAGLLGGAALLCLTIWSRRASLLRWGDALAPAAAVGLAVGMLGLPLAGEGWGIPTSGPFAMNVDQSLRPLAFISATRFHPIYAYEAVLFAVVAIVGLMLSRGRRYEDAPQEGTSSLFFIVVAMVGYAALRPLSLDATTPATETITQAVCIGVALAALVMLVPRLWRAHINAEITREIEHVRQRGGVR